MKKSWPQRGHLVIFNPHLEYLEINNLIKKCITWKTKNLNESI